MKNKYNQGDLAQYTNNDGSRDLLVITKVFEVLGGLRYTVRWLADNTGQIQEPVNGQACVCCVGNSRG